jgi:hypothetical protein
MKIYRICVPAIKLACLLAFAGSLSGCYTLLSHPEIDNGHAGGEYSASEYGKTCMDCHGSRYYSYHFPRFHHDYWYRQYGYYGYYHDSWFWYYWKPWWWDYDWNDDDGESSPSLPGKRFFGDRRTPTGGTGSTSADGFEGAEQNARELKMRGEREDKGSDDGGPKSMEKRDKGRRSRTTGKMEKQDFHDGGDEKPPVIREKESKNDVSEEDKDAAQSRKRR